MFPSLRAAKSVREERARRRHDNDDVMEADVSIMLIPGDVKQELLQGLGCSEIPALRLRVIAGR